jgi:regulator of protease activity HflC (stomatin/prohibitin superfamily)
MKIILQIFSVLVLALWFTGCSPSKIDAGQEGVMVKKPWVFGHGGVDDTPLVTGLVWTAWSTEVVRVSVKPFNMNEKFDDLITLDNNPVDFEVHMTFKHTQGKTPILVEHFGLQGEDGQGWYASKLQQPLRNDVRSFVKEQSMFGITTDPRISDKLQSVITEKIRLFIKQNNIPTELLNVSVGKVMPPETVITSTLETAAQKQRVLTQEATVKAEQAREIAQKATAKADKAYMNEMAMTPAQYLKNKELDIIREKKDVQVFLGAMPQPVVGLK